MRAKLGALLAAVLLLGPLSGWSGEASAGFNEKFEPADGKTLVIVGQDRNEMNAYVNISGLNTAGFMFYTNTQQADGVTSSYDAGGGIQDFQHWDNYYSNSVMQIGLYMVGDLDNVTNGSRNANLDKLANAIAASNKPVFLRIGYEFDGPWNSYDPTKYKNAYKYIVDRFNSKGLTNVAYVWHSAAWPSTYNNYAYADWYPGDSYVDWVAVSWFSDEGSATARNALASFATSHSKPLMIAEAAPKEKYEPSKGQTAWDNWFDPVFDWIEANNVKAYSYINQDWDAQSMWVGQGWGDTRIQTNSTVESNWKSRTGGSRYLHSSTDLFDAIGFTQSLPGVIEAEGYKAMSGVQLGSDDGSGVVGWIDTGDWLDYKVNVTSAGWYAVKYRVASPNSGTQLQLKSGSSTLHTVNLPNTGQWYTYNTVSGNNVYLNAGIQTIRVHASTGGFNINYLELTK